MIKVDKTLDLLILFVCQSFVTFKKRFQNEYGGSNEENHGKKPGTLLSVVLDISVYFF